MPSGLQVRRVLRVPKGLQVRREPRAPQALKGQLGRWVLRAQRDLPVLRVRKATLVHKVSQVLRVPRARLVQLGLLELLAYKVLLGNKGRRELRVQKGLRVFRV